MQLSAFNRVAHVEVGSPSHVAGVLPLDRITHIDGVLLTTDGFAELEEGREIAVTIERPPRGLHDAISAKEDAPGATSPLMLPAPNLPSRLSSHLEALDLQERSSSPRSKPTSPLTRSSYTARWPSEQPGASLTSAPSMEAPAQAPSAGLQADGPQKPPLTHGLAGGRHRRNSSEPVNALQMCAGVAEQRLADRDERILGRGGASDAPHVTPRSRKSWWEPKRRPLSDAAERERVERQLQDAFDVHEDSLEDLRVLSECASIDESGGF